MAHLVLVYIMENESDEISNWLFLLSNLKEQFFFEVGNNETILIKSVEKSTTLLP